MNYNYIVSKLVIFPISVGIVPESLSDAKALLFIEFNDKDKYQKNSYKFIKLFKFPISVGIVPKRSLEAKNLDILFEVTKENKMNIMEN